MTKKKQPAEVGIKTRVESALLDLDAVLLKRGLLMRPVMNFPARRRVPLLARLFLWFVKLQGGIMDLEFRIRK